MRSARSPGSATLPSVSTVLSGVLSGSNKPRLPSERESHPDSLSPGLPRSLAVPRALSPATTPALRVDWKLGILRRKAQGRLQLWRMSPRPAGAGFTAPDALLGIKSGQLPSGATRT